MYFVSGARGRGTGFALFFFLFFSPPKHSTVERKANRMLPEFISSWKDAADLGGKTETAFLLKELDTLRAKNKKVQLRYSDHSIALLSLSYKTYILNCS